VNNVAMDSLFWQTQVAVSEAGTMAFIPGSDRGIGKIVSRDTQGAEREVVTEPMMYSVIDLSFDDRLMAVHIGDVEDHVWVFDMDRREGRRLPGSEGYGWPKFSREDTIALSSLYQGAETIILAAELDGRPPRQLLKSSDVFAYVGDWSPSGDQLTISNWKDGGSVGLLPVDESAQLEFLSDHGEDWGAVFSPDGRWLAYSSNETGRYEIWIRPSDGTGNRRQLSVNGGIEGVWCPCGKVFYRRGEEIWATSVDLDPDPQIGSEELQFTMPDFLDTPGRSYDVSSDGELLYYVKLAEPPINDRIHVISNWLGTIDVAADAAAPQ
jgi:Tol biopolymer transport system component